MFNVGNKRLNKKKKTLVHTSVFKKNGLSEIRYLMAILTFSGPTH